MPVFHLYTDVSDIKRKLHWDEEEDKKREIKWHEREKKSIERLSQIIDGKLDGIFGLGDKRSLEDYEFLSGINFKKRSITNKGKAVTAEFISSLSWKESPF